MPTLIQHRQEFRLGTFFRRLSMEGPFVDVITNLGVFPDEAGARRKAQALLAEDPRLTFQLISNEGKDLGWPGPGKAAEKLREHCERVNRWVQVLTLILLNWLAMGWLNDGLFARGTLLGMTLVALFFGIFAFTQNQIEAFVAWVMIFTMSLLAIPALEKVKAAREKVESQHAAEQSTVAPGQLAPDSR